MSMTPSRPYLVRALYEWILDNDDVPYLVVDAACASSLQALAIGARSLLAGGVDQAIVGGASYCKSDSLVLFSAAQSVSNNGSFPFGPEADGSRWGPSRTWRWGRPRGRLRRGLWAWPWRRGWWSG